MSTHARLSPSASGTWMVCPGAVPFAEKHGLKGKETIYAAIGTAVHELSEKCLLSSGVPDHHVGQIFYGQLITQELADIATTYVEYVRSIEADLKLYEQRFEVRGVENCAGTADTVWIDEKTKTLGTVDLKTGAGVKVDAHENTQQMIYALGAYDHYSVLYDIQQISVTIVQPPKNSIDTYTFSVDRLERFREELIAAADTISEAEAVLRELSDETQAEDWVFVPGEKQCRFCRSKPRCPGLRKMTQEAAAQEFSPSVKEKNQGRKFGDAYLREWMEKKPLIDMFLKSIEEEIKARLHAGKRVTGYKLAVGRTTRDYVDRDRAEKELFELFGEDIYTEPALRSVAQMEKLPAIKEAEFDLGPYIQEIKHPAVVPEDSKKPAWDPNTSARQDFMTEAEE